MGVYTDPLNSRWSANSWRGSDEDDTLVYGAGDDIINGGNGYDTLVIPVRKSDAIIGAYLNGSISFSHRHKYYESPIGPEYDLYDTDNVTAVGIEQLQFSDEVVTLAERQVAQAPVATNATNQLAIPLGRGGFWGRSNYSAKRGWLVRKKRGLNQYLVDSDVQLYSSEDIGETPLALSGGSWANTQRIAARGGTLLYSGNNVIAFFEDWSVAQFDAASKV